MSLIQETAEKLMQNIADVLFGAMTGGTGCGISLEADRRGFHTHQTLALALLARGTCCLKRVFVFLLGLNWPVRAEKFLYDYTLYKIY